MFIKLDELPESINPTMTAQVEVIVDQAPNVLTVPVAAVFTEQEQRYCFLSDAGKWERKWVQTGRMSDQRIEIVSGLSRGDLVMLNPPSALLPPPKLGGTDRNIEADLPRPTERPTAGPTSRPGRRPASRPVVSNGPKEVARQ
jgi:hypothetical protein